MQQTAIMLHIFNYQAILQIDLLSEYPSFQFKGKYDCQIMEECSSTFLLFSEALQKLRGECWGKLALSIKVALIWN